MFKKTRAVQLGYNYIFKYKSSAFFNTFLKDLEISVLDIDIYITTIFFPNVETKSTAQQTDCLSYTV
jgi:hypothetical protein